MGEFNLAKFVYGRILANVGIKVSFTDESWYIVVGKFKSKRHQIGEILKIFTEDIENKLYAHTKDYSLLLA